MKNFPCIKMIKRNIKDGLIEVEISNNIMENPCSVYFLDKMNQAVIDDITQVKKLPLDLTRITLEIIPSSMTKYLYSLNGLETIIYNLFRGQNEQFQEDLKKGNVYLKTYYKRDDYYTIPVLCLEVIFLRNLHSKTIDHLRKILRSELLIFTGNVGDIDFGHIESEVELEEYLSVPLIVGAPEFIREGVFKKKNFTDEQLIEMNHVHTISLIELNMNDVINNNYLTLYDEIRSNIRHQDDFTQDDEYTIVQTLFPKDDFEDLPF